MLKIFLIFLKVKYFQIGQINSIKKFNSTEIEKKKNLTQLNLYSLGWVVWNGLVIGPYERIRSDPPTCSIFF